MRRAVLSSGALRAARQPFVVGKLAGITLRAVRLPRGRLDPALRAAGAVLLVLCLECPNGARCLVSRTVSYYMASARIFTRRRTLRAGKLSFRTHCVSTVFTRDDIHANRALF